MKHVLGLLSVCDIFFYLLDRILTQCTHKEILSDQPKTRIFTSSGVQTMQSLSISHFGNDCDVISGHSVLRQADFPSSGSADFFEFSLTSFS